MIGLEELLLRLREGTLTPEEAGELERLLANPSARVRAAEELFAIAAIREGLGMDRKGKPLLRLPEESGAAPGTRRSTRRGTERSLAAGWKHSLGPVFVAAGVLCAVALFLVLTPSERDSATSRIAKEARARASREAETRTQAERDRRERERALTESEAKRRDREARLEEIRRKQEELARSAAQADPAPAEQEKRKAEEKRLAGDKERIEQELREAAELAKRAERPAPAGPPQEEKPPTAPVTPPTPPQETTQAALARVEEVSGEASLMTKEGKSPLVTGANVFATQQLETGGGTSRLVLRLPDNTRVDLGPDTVLPEIRTDSGKQLTLSQGTVRAVVAKQPKGQAMLFLTPHGQAKVVGTTLRLVVDPDPKRGTKLEVEEGKVELKNLAGKTVMVESGHYAVATVGVELVARKLPSQKRLAYIFRQPQDGWCAVRQTVSLIPGQTYILSAWIRTTVPNSAQMWGRFPGGSIGVRTETGALLAQQPFGQSESYARTVLTFKAGSNRTAILFAGFANGTNAIAWMHVTEWSLTAKGGDGVNLVQDPNYEEQNPASAQLSSPWSVEGADPSQVRCAGQEPYRGRSPAPGGSEGERK